MDIERGNLEILFRWISYRHIPISEGNVEEVFDCFHIDRALYMEQCHRVFSGRSEDERNHCYYYLEQKMKKRTLYPASVFQLILDVTDCFFSYKSGKVFCKFDHLLRWREISLTLGQDLFVCAYLADYDIQRGTERREFSWLPILLCDNSRILSILKKGIAENHFHLKGSSRIFEVNWICLMNHIDGREKEFRKIDKELQRSGESKKDFGIVLYKECKNAAIYRLYLFAVLQDDEWILKKIECMLDDSYDIDIAIYDVQNLIELTKEKYGTKICSNMKDSQEDIPDKTEAYCLDYAYKKELFDENQSSYRILIGERYFLYACFRACFSQKFSRKQQNIFYRYLKLRISFRKEIIQVNGEIGFQNFCDYEQRKEYFIEKYPKYRKEYIAMAIKSQLEREYLKYLELRVTPKFSAIDLYKMMKDYNYIYISPHWNVENRVRYVMHFPKSSDDREKSLSEVRNKKARKDNKKRARALVKMLKENQPLSLGIVGIDACASEIGCRPEVFGQIFRYLTNQDFQVGDGKSIISGGKDYCSKQLYTTYHVGEDFFDIVDGLRAVDEAIIFCGLVRGSRIGHALALGIDPVEYYWGKSHHLLLKKQDHIDDIAWMLYTANMYGCTVEPRLRLRLMQEFQNLFHDVYRNYPVEYSHLQIIDYYQSWTLRGDAPELYWLDWKTFLLRNKNKGNEIEEWDRFSFNLCKDVDEELRKIEMYYRLNRDYFYDPDVRRRGREIVRFKIDDMYVDLVRQVQDCMIKKLVKRGIGIETNPSSNYLIGTIRRYDQHPILRFNSRKLLEVAPNTSLSVSLNTDDQGVFDTLLENEYALMALALEKSNSENGKKKYDIEDIYEWLNYVREMGLEQAFEP